jgi:RNA polymerase sigma-B factor
MKWTSADREREHQLLVEFDTARELSSPEASALREQLVTMHIPLVHYVARRYSGRGETLEDIQQVGTVGLIKAIDGFDVHHGAAFSSYAVPKIAGEIKQHLRDRTWAVHVPRSVQERSRAVSKATDTLLIELNRTPSVQEIADHLEVSVDDVVEAIDAAHAQSTRSMDSLSENSDYEPQSADDDVFALIENRETLRPLLAELDERERRILTMRFAENKSQSVIAKELGMSQMHVSRLLAHILQQLRIGLQ